MSSLTSRLADMDRRVLAAIAAVVLVVLVAGTVGGVYAYQQSIPTTSTVTPRDGAREVGLDQPIKLTFTRPVSAANLAAHLHISPATEGALMTAGPGGPIAASASRTAAAAGYSWVPADPWSDLTQYTVRLDGFEDAGHTVRGGLWHFTTTIVPRIVAVNTDSGAGVANDAEIPLGTTLAVVFNTPMDAASVQLSANGQPATLAWSDDGKTATVKTQGMKAGALQLALAAGADRLGHRAATGWKLDLSLVFKINIHTTPLKYPALVQVPNDPTAWDQSGLQSADMVFEYATEGNIPRFTAVFTKVPDTVGPVRSGRLISIKLTQHYRGELFLSGTSEGTFAVLRQSGIYALFDTVGYYYRSSARPAPNNLYISGDAIARSEGLGNLAPFQLRTGKPNVPSGEGGQEVTVAQNGSTYKYDAGTDTYSKTEAGHTFSDASIGQPLRIGMLIVMHTRVTTTNIIEDSNGAHGLDYDLDSGGTAEIYAGGQKATGRWSSPDSHSPLVFTLANGQQLTLPAGLVWVDVVP